MSAPTLETAMAVPTSGGHPIKAPPGFYRFLAEFELLRQITSRSRSILPLLRRPRRRGPPGAG
ncbi:hypothetical protein [Streptomyces sviceus]|uniref:hypothetical protein n=1 Tax=Streptomyces sviceus TaxID=285530 RepID=UPI0036EAF6B7